MFRIVQGILPQGFLVVTVYLYTGEDLTGRNWRLLSAVGERIFALGLPFVLGGDMQNHPDQLRATMWAQFLDAVVVNPGKPTCFTGANPSYVRGIGICTCDRPK